MTLEEIRKQRRREQQRRYNLSAKGKLAHQRYKAGAAGWKVRQQLAQRRYRKTLAFKTWNAAYRKRPDIRQRINAWYFDYYRRPGVAAKKFKANAEYRRRPEVNLRIREHMREYNQRPEVIVRRKAFQAKPENKEKARKWSRAYRKTPRGRLTLRRMYPIPSYVNRGLAMTDVGNLVTTLKEKMK